MKTRTGFVSNSSSSSFLIYGACIDSDEAIELTKKLGSAEEVDDVYGALELIESLLDDNDVKLEIHCPYDGESGLYIGRSWDKIGDDETGKEFKERVKADVLKLFKGQCPNIQFGTHEEAWQDG